MARWILTVLAVLIGGFSLFAASPTVGLILPRGGQRGTEVLLRFQGANLADAVEVMAYEPGVRIEKLESIAANEVTARAVISADCRLGEHAFRIRTATGVSDLRTFWVGALPIIDEKEPNNDFANPQPIPMNTTVHGSIGNEDVDYFAVECKKGQRLSVEIEALRLAGPLFDPCVTIYDARQFELAMADDAYITAQDSGAALVVPADGRYIIQVRETAYGAGSYYRLHIGDFPRPTAVLPAGGRPGETVELRYLGDPLGEIRQQITIPEQPPAGGFRVHAATAEGIHPAGIPFRINDLPAVTAAEPSNQLSNAPAMPVPGAYHGVVAAAGESSFVKFQAQKGQVLDVAVHARRLGSPLDPVLHVLPLQADGKLGAAISSVDDTGGPDPQTRVTIPADGEYVLRIHDHLHNGGPTFVYRVEVRPPQPSASIRLPRADGNNSTNQDRQAWSVPRGGRLAVPLLIQRNDWGGPAELVIDHLPPGVTAKAPPLDFANATVPVLLEASADAPLAGGFVLPRVVPQQEGVVLRERPTFETVLTIGQNNTTFHALLTDRVALAVAEPAPFSIEVQPPKAPLVQNGAMQLKVVAQRAEGFTKPITVFPVLTLPNIGINGSTVIPEGGTECLVPVNAAPNAAVRTWKLAFMAVADAGAGNVWVGSDLFDLQVAAPFVSLAQQRAAVEQGASTAIACKVTVHAPFEGKARAVLMGLPPKVTAEAVEFDSTAEEIVFTVGTDKASPAGKHNLYVQMTLMHAGEPVVHHTGGAELRIDVPLPPKTSAAAQPAGATQAPTPATAPTPPPASKPTSRLEQLRREQQEREKNAKPEAERKPPAA